MIDRLTVDKILDATDIVDVVSDFVALRRRGTNWVGLCPFHNDRRPSFYVSRTKQICKCFSCGKGGSAVNFLMEHEQFSYVEALRYLAKKYGIEIHERELTDEERAQQTERESMLLLNEWAMKYFEDQLHNTTDGREIGLSYFTERGMNQESIHKFHLGYCPDQRGALYEAATKAGFSRNLLFQTGLCIDDKHGGGYDRFRGRVMFPVLNVAGKVVAFGGRTLKNDPAKYVNSPESTIYNKRKELYGLFQAKRAIAKQGKCFIVEGYFDVISMHQAGFENVIASSGTALTDDHIQKIHRFTNDVTELFDGDAAGIHAALRGVDMLLKQGLNIKVLVLPNPEDPDSFARGHSSSQVQAYIDEHEEDFMRFKTNVLLKDSAGDPIKRAEAISDIVRSIAVIPDAITRSVYAKECSQHFGIGEDVIMAEIGKAMGREQEQEWKRRERETQRAQAQAQRQQAQQPSSPATATPSNASVPNATSAATHTVPKTSAMEPYERALITYVVKFGMCKICTMADEQGNSYDISVVEYCYSEMENDKNMKFTVPAYQKIYQEAVGLINSFYNDLDAYQQSVQKEIDQARREALVKMSADAVGSLAEINDREKDINNQLNLQLATRLQEFREQYLEKRLISSPDTQVREVSCDIVSQGQQLSKIHTQFVKLPTDVDRLPQLVPLALCNWKLELVKEKKNKLIAQMKGADADTQTQLMKQIAELNGITMSLSMETGRSAVSSF